ncbi:nitronate monooxygenase family protein [Alicyclobacillus sp. SO9]|uniref:NAD(P)H-dependent flavin oxidoreductase n=1 Tax=Alicyclobacillus sp. SO9 TaxID=2665646 RepID=UPI0018E829AC|nr:nitronate monooxygenase [Alicyclobacillus sp. SO9]QQE79020.1 nitronate monooxygenase [Alicyclobacillus sp. SO9]
MWPKTALIETLGIRLPVIQAGMAGGITTPELVAAVSNAGGLGSLGAGYMTPQQIREAIGFIKAKTDKPFAVNLFIPERERSASSTIDSSPEKAARHTAASYASEIQRMKTHLQPYREELGLTPSTEPDFSFPDFEQQLEVLLDEHVPVFSCTFGAPDVETVKRMKAAGMIVMGTATTVREAKVLENRGMDMIVMQGHEAGGHRGTFLHKAEDALVGVMALIPQAVDSLHIPVIAAGGIMDARGIVASLALGAEGVQMGSAFLTCTESGATTAYKEKLINSSDESTTLTTAFSGKAARGIRNEFIASHENYDEPVPPYPFQNALTKELRAAAKQQSNTDMMSLWSGQAAGLATTCSAAELLSSLNKEVESVLSRLLL